MLNAGAYVTTSLAGNGSAFAAADLQTAVAGNLAAIDTLRIVQLQVNTPNAWQNLLNAQIIDYQYTATVTVQTLGDFNDPSDVESIITHAFYEGSGGFMPASFTSQVTTDIPAQPAPPASAFSGVGSTLSGIGNALQTDTQLTLVILAVILLAVVFVVGPTVARG